MAPQSRIDEARRRAAAAKQAALSLAAAGFLAIAHGLTAGTDAGATWALTLYAGSAWLVLALLFHRISRHWNPVRSTERRTQWQ